MIISLILVAIAAMFNAVMDRVENDVSFNKSVFRWKDKRFWCKDVSWQYAKKIFGWKADAWHIAKTLMIISIAFAMIFFHSIGRWWMDVLLIGAVWNLSFNIFYNKLLKQ